MIKKLVTLKKHHQLFFSLIILSGVVCLWRGIWGLLDIYLTPNNLPLSFSLSIIVGTVIISLTHYTINKLV